MVKLFIRFVIVCLFTDVLILHHKSSSKNKDLLPYLAISHVRDMLIPPSERCVVKHSNSTFTEIQIEKFLAKRI